ncbi:hypothetical protein BCR35DRAFT_302188 [Leucosporidium creatinivorum]|uniref:Uncharacterized protein n=1 Tax=Leucosporidium creatinivorum TaxID=106004 RepID=A0A1Y2FTV5_9BASI|nr:hypothetical protein BCR35DRAFT_302188 [Leucosporidium creatinivorum]
MASSLSPSCNPPKHAYDTCFNTWFKSYLILVSPPFSSPLDTAEGRKEREKRAKEIESMKAKLEGECGGRYKEYQECLKREIPTKEDLPSMLESARKEEPLDGWGGIKVATEEDLKR